MLAQLKRLGRTRRSTGSAGSSRGCSPSSCCRSTRTTSRPPATGRSRRSSPPPPCSRSCCARDLERVLPLLLRRGGPRRSCPSSAPRSGSRWRRRRLGLVLGLAFASQIADWLHLGSRGTLVYAPARRDLGADELRAADLALPRRGALGAYAIASLANVLITIGATVLLVVVFDKGRRRRSSATSSARSSSTPSSLGYRREQLGLAVRPRAVPRDEPLRDAARARRRSRSGRSTSSTAGSWLLQGPERGRRLLGRREDRLGGGLPPARVPHRLARVRLLDHGRPRAKRAYAFVLTYVLLVTCWLSLALGAARALARGAAGAEPRLPARVRGGRAARLLRGESSPATRCSRSARAARADAAELGDLGLAAVVNIGLNVC